MALSKLMTVIIMKAIREENRPIDEHTLQVICDTIEDTKSVKIVSAYEDKGNVFGVYINDVYDSLSFQGYGTKNDIVTDIDGHNLFFFELGFMIRAIYKYGSMHIYDILMHDSDIAFAYDNEYQEIIDTIRENPPISQVVTTIISDISTLNQDTDYSNLNRFIDYINVSNLIYDFGFFDEVIDERDFVKAMNGLSKLKQDLLAENFQNVSEKKMNDLNRLFVELSIKIFILDRI